MTSKMILQELNAEPEEETQESSAAAADSKLTDDEALDVLLDAYGRNAGETKAEEGGDGAEIDIDPEEAAE